MADSKEIVPLFPGWKFASQGDAHHRFFIALVVGVLATFATPWSWGWPTRMCVIWNAYTLTVLLLTWAVLVTADPAEAARTASLQDSSRTFIFCFVIVAAVASILAVGLELLSAKGGDKFHLLGHILFAGLTIMSSWTLVHTVFTLRYAHIYYDNTPPEDAGGLTFPSESRPDFLDFAYFSFTIGMCFQTSDVSIISRRMRRLVLVHGVVAFIFNAAILGLSINVVAGLFS